MMTRRLWTSLTALVLLTALPAVTSCSAYQAYAQRKAIEQAKFSLRGVQLLGLDLIGANVLITLQLDNPTETDIELDRLDYTLFVNDIRAFSGAVNQRIHVPAGQGRPLPISVGLAYRDMSAQIRQLVAMRQITSWRVSGLAHFDTPVGTIDYPIELQQRP